MDLRRLAVGLASTGTAAVVLVLSGCTIPAERTQTAPPSPFPSVLPTRVAPPDGLLDGSSRPVADPVYPAYGNPALDVLKYDLVLDWQPRAKTLSGTATLSIRLVSATDEIALDFSGAFAIASASVDGAATASRRSGDHLVLPVGRSLAAGVMVTVVLGYSGTPKVTPFPGTRRDVPSSGVHVGRDGELWAMQEPYGAFTWFPCSDQPSDRALFDVSITAPNGWSGVSSGRFLGSQPAPGGGSTWRWHATEPIATYVLAFAVGRYQRYDAVGPRGVPVTLWIRPEDETFSLALARKTPDLLAWLEHRFGPYPFSSAGVVVVPDSSAMETQTMVTLGQLSGSSGESVLLHELAHQWFGDAVAPRTWRDVWLNEGFAMYIEVLYGADRLGVDLDRRMRDFWADERETRVRIGAAGNYNPKFFGEHNVYFGPALMLHEIRRTLGEERFFAMLHDWVQLHRHTNQDRASFTAWLNEYTGMDLSPIIAKWLDAQIVPPFPG